MATYYVGAGGNDGNNGTTWALRKATLNGAEDLPVSAGDEVVVGPGVYRELLTCDVSGSSGSPITYTADVSGRRTDGVGGIVRITGSDNDQSATRANCIVASDKDFRTFTGFSFDTTTGTLLSLTNAATWIIQDCTYQNGVNVAGQWLNVSGADQLAVTVRRCAFLLAYETAYGIQWTADSAIADAGHVLENCLVIGSNGLWSNNVGGVTLRNCLTMGATGYGFIVLGLAGGSTCTVNNCILVSHSTALYAGSAGMITEDYNALYGNATARVNVAAGANSNTYPPLLNPPMLLAGYRVPWLFGELSSWSQVKALTGTGMATDDLFGITRPATASKKSWGAVQYMGQVRSTAQYQAGAASLKLPDAGRVQWFVPASAESTVVSVYVLREADYTGTSPQLILKQSGQSDVTVTDAGTSAQWNQISGTVTPGSYPAWIMTELVSNNTATSGTYGVYFDTLAVS